MPEEVFEVPQTTEPKATNWPKIILAAVLGLGLLAGAAYAGYWYGTESAKLKTQNQITPTPTTEPTPVVEDETRDWETYTNTKYRYSVKYPPTAVAAEHPPTGEERIQETTVGFFSPDGMRRGLNIILTVIKNPDKKTPMQFAQEKYNQTEEMIINRSLEGDISKCKVEPVIRSKTNGARFTSCSTPAASGGILNFSEWYVKNGVTYEIYAVLIDEDYLTTFNQILSTFKFLD